MRKLRMFSGTAIMVAALVAAGGCDSDSPTESGIAPVISELQVQSAQRGPDDLGVVSIIFSYLDPDRDVDRVVFQLDGGGTVTSSLDDTDGVSGVASHLQSVALPAAGNEVRFFVLALDRRGNRSNTLAGEFVAP